MLEYFKVGFFIASGVFVAFSLFGIAVLSGVGIYDVFQTAKKVDKEKGG
jgi:hypothetical protein